MSQSLYQKLQACKSEEDVKDAYIKALGLKGGSRNLINTASANGLQWNNRSWSIVTHLRR